MDERPEEICDATKQFNRKIGEKQREMGRPHGKDGCRHTSEESGEKGEKTSRMQEKGN